MRIKFEMMIFYKVVTIEMEISELDIREFCNIDGDIVVDDKFKSLVIDALNEDIRYSEVESLEFPDYEIKNNKSGKTFMSLKTYKNKYDLKRV